MVGTEKNKHFPIIGLQEFSKDQLKVKNQVLFNGLHGERHIEKPHQFSDWCILDQIKKLWDFTIMHK